MRILFLAAAILIGFHFSVGTARADWVNYADPKGAFTVEFPGAPTVDEKENTTQAGLHFHETTYLANFGNAQFMVLFFQYDTALSSDTLDNVAGSLVSEDLKLVSTKTTSVDGHEGRLVTLTDKDGFHYEFRVFVVGKRLYQADSVLPKDSTSAESAAVRRFSSSFHITK